MSLHMILRACWLALFSPVKFAEMEVEYSQVLAAKSVDRPVIGNIDRVRTALVQGLLLTLTAMASGMFVAFLVSTIADSKLLVATFGGVGALVLLWATLSVRGWDIQTFSGNSLAEAVNRWLYRFMSWTGTMLLTAAATLGFA